MQTDFNKGVCGTCARPAEATFSNQGYSDCCNDRIEYGAEAEQTVRRHNCDHTHVAPDHDDPIHWVECQDCGAELLREELDNRKGQK